MAPTAFYGMILMVVPIAAMYGTVDPWLIHLTTTGICFFGSLRMLDGLLKKEFRFAEPTILLPLLLLVIYTVVQFLPVPQTLSLDAAETRRTAMRFVGLLVFAEVLFHYADNRKRLKILLSAVLFVGIGSALFAWARIVFGFNLERLPPSVGFGQFINRNHFAFLAEMTLGVLGGWLFRRRLASHWRLAAGAAAFLIFVTLIVSNSRGAIFALAGMGFFAVLLFTARNDKAQTSDTGKRDNAGSPLFFLKKSWALILIVFFAGAFIFAVAFIGGDPVVSRLEKLSTEVEASETIAYKRIDVWRATLEMIREKPLQGAGFGAYGAAITRYDKSPGSMILQQAHNDYLELAASGGLVGVLLIIVFLAVFLRRARRQIHSPNEFRRSAAFGALVGITGVLLHSFADFGLHTSINAFIFIILIVAAAADLDQTASKINPAAESTFVRFARMAFFILCFGAILLTGVQSFRSGVSCFLSDRAALTSQIVFGDQAIFWDEKNARAFETRGQIHFLHRDYDKARADFESAIVLRPNDYLLRLQAAAVFMQTGDFAAARSFLSEAERLAPHYAAPAWLMGKAFLKEKNYEQAFQSLNRGANRNPKLFHELIVEANFVYFNDPAIDRAVVPETHAAKMIRALFYVEQNIESPANEAFMTSGEPSDSEKDQFIERLLRRKNFELARRIWKTKTTSAAQAGEIIANGDFEADLSVAERSFGWRIGSLTNVEMTRTTERFYSPARALKVVFSGNSNPEQPILSQLILLEPNTEYRLSFAVNIADDFRSGGLPVVTLADTETNNFLAASSSIDATGGGWKVISLKFQSGADTRAALLTITRNNCSTSPCPAFGSVFFDDFKLSGK